MTPATTPNLPLLPILSDQPAYYDQLDFSPYAKTLSDIISDPGTLTPLTIGVFGGWGQGKTSLMNMVQRRLDERDAAARPLLRQPLPVAVEGQRAATRRKIEVAAPHLGQQQMTAFPVPVAQGLVHGARPGPQSRGWVMFQDVMYVL